MTLLEPQPPLAGDPVRRQGELGRLGDALLAAQRVVHEAAAARFRAIDMLRQRWEDVHGASLATDPSGIMSRSLRAEVGAILSVAERTAETLLWTSRALVHELPATLHGLAEGRFSERHARILADASVGLEPDQRRELETRALRHAEVLNPAKFARKVRSLRMLLNADTLEERKRVALAERDLELEPAKDGMAWLSLYLAAEDAVAAWNFADSTARRLAAGQGETRTVPQLRVDVLRDLLLDGAGLLPPREGETELREQAARPRGVVPSVHVTAPALALAGIENIPAELAGYGPIDPGTARVLAGAAAGFYRILTDPGSGAVLQFGRDRYPVPAELRRYLIQRDGTCRFVGCNRSADLCDLDHSVAWEDSGSTDADNLAALCRNHHTVKHHGGWKVRHDPDRPGVLWWTSPIGYEFTTEPAMEGPRRPKVAEVRAQAGWAAELDSAPPF